MDAAQTCPCPVGPGGSCPASSPLLVFLAAVLSSIAKQRQAQQDQKAQAVSSGNGPLSEYDYVVVGGGSAGCVLAARLSERASARVLLLERGGREPAEARVPAYTVNNLNSKLAELVFARAEDHNCNGTGCLLNIPSVLGGGSTINGMLYVRGSHENYDRWATLTGDRRWSFDSVLPYFKKSEDNLDADINVDRVYHGTGGPQKVSRQPYTHPVVPQLAKAFRAIGVPEQLDINAASQLGYSDAQTTQAHGERWSTFRSYLEPVIGKRPNLHVETFATARRVVLERTFLGPKAVGVEYKDAAGKIKIVRARKEVILSAGALHSPQILMLSGIGPAKQLQAAGIPLVKELPVGEGLMDHPDIPGVQYKCEPPLCVTDWSSRQQDLREYNETRTGALAAFSVLHFMAFSRTSIAKPGTGITPDVQTLFLGNSVTDDTTCLRYDGWRLNRLTAWASLMQPYSEGWVRLNTSDPYGPPVVSLNYFGDREGRDLATALEGLKLVLRLAEPLAGLGLTLDKDFVPECSYVITATSEKQF